MREKTEPRNLILDYLDGDDHWDIADRYGYSDNNSVFRALTIIRKKARSDPAAFARRWGLTLECIEAFLRMRRRPARKPDLQLRAAVLAVVDGGRKSRAVAVGTGVKLMSLRVMVSMERRRRRDAAAGV